MTEREPEAVIRIRRVRAADTPKFEATCDFANYCAGTSSDPRDALLYLLDMLGDYDPNSVSGWDRLEKRLKEKRND